MISVLLQTSANVCEFGGLNTNNWIGISATIIMVSLLIASFIYVASGFVSRKDTEKIRGYVRFEYVQAVLSAAIIVALLVLSSFSCNISASLTTPSQNAFSFAQHYVGDLLFIKGVGLETSLYATGIQFGIYSGVVSEGFEKLTSYLPTLPPLRVGSLNFTMEPPNDFGALYENYASVLIDVYIPLLIASFAMLLIQFLLIPIVSGSVLTVVIPVAIIMRSLSFTGPKLREAANTFIAIGVAFYFIYPMTFIMDQQIVNWMYCSQTIPNCGNPYPQYIAPYELNTINPSTLFASQNPSSDPLNIGILFYQTPLSQLWNSVYSGSGGLQANPFIAIFYAPGVVVNLASQVSEYLFQAIVLMALNMAITIGFAIGLWKGISGGLNFLGGEHFF